METTPGLPLLGQALPEFTAETTRGTLTLPRDAAGRWLILFSHPADFTPVCTTEFCSFQKRIAAFHELGTMLVGLSVDPLSSHLKWIEWMKEKLHYAIEFPIIADTHGEIAARLGMIHPGKGTKTVRTLFIADPEGIVRLTICYPQEVGRSLDEILRVLKALQVSDSTGCSIPANWPRNGLIGDHVVIRPPADEEQGRQNMYRYEGYDWWFCHKPL